MLKRCHKEDVHLKSKVIKGILKNRKKFWERCCKSYTLRAMR